MKLAYLRNGKFVESADRDGLSSEGRQILEQMEESNCTGWVEYNIHLIADETETETEE